jgi:hypothetical protein
MKNPPPSPHSSARPRLRVWAERRPDPDWDRFLAALVALSLRRVEEEDAERSVKEDDA